MVIRFTDGDFKQLLDRDELHYTTLTAGVVANITYPNLPVATMAALLARLARALCLHAPLHLSRERWFVRVLDEALGERDLIELHDALQHALSGPFHLMPVDHSFMRDLIRRWADGKWTTRSGRPLGTSEH